jgi:glycosyltransferase involved in cell wall biosynthesis
LLIYLCLAIILLLAYSVITLYYRHTWQATPIFKTPEHLRISTTISVIIPARNEAKHIRKCLDHLLAQQYPEEQFEILVINDHSTDKTADIVRSFHEPRIQLLELAQYLTGKEPIISFKKKAIELGIVKAKGHLILTTDADCWMPPTWLHTIAAFYQKKKPVMIAAPVVLEGEETSLQRFQALDFTGMMAVTAAGIHSKNMHLANGANLCYEKHAFEAVSGFQDIDQLASGDDLLLMQKMARRFPGKIAFCKSLPATVYTSVQPDWNSFLEQRVRWATKSAKYPDWRITVVLAIVFILCWGILISFLLAPFFGVIFFWIGLAALLGKSAIDYLLLSSTTAFFNRTSLMKSFITSQLWHIAYIAGLGLLANIRKQYRWKGRLTH